MFIRRAVAVMLLVAAPVMAASWPDVPKPEDMTVANVSKHIVFNGLDMRAQVFQSRLSEKEIIAFYRKTWGRRMVVNSLGDSKLIGHKQGDYYITVQISESGGGTKGQIGSMNIASAPDHISLGKGLPTPMGAKVFNDISYPDDTVPARTVAMRDGLSPRQNASYFKERLLGQGWKPAAGNQCRTGDSCVLRFTRGDSKMTLMVMKATSGGGQSQVVINVQNPEVSS